jgi:predicted DNA-binding protein (MmcQ/YjbR family)
MEGVRMGLNEVIRKLSDHAVSLPGAYEDHPWGENVFKVNRKIFVFMGLHTDQPTELSFTVKLPHSYSDALNFSFCRVPGYNLGKSGWVQIKIPAEEIDSAPVDLFKRWIEESYRAIATRKLVAQLNGKKG